MAVTGLQIWNNETKETEMIGTTALKLGLFNGSDFHGREGELFIAFYVNLLKKSLGVSVWFALDIVN